MTMKNGHFHYLYGWTARAVCLAGWLLLAAQAPANVWLNEDFDDGLAFNSEDVDPYAGGGSVATALALGMSGASVSCERTFRGQYALHLEPGGALGVPAGAFDNPGNGPFQYLQMALAVDAIPAGQSTLGTLRWNWDVGEQGTATRSFFVQLRSREDAVDVVAGEDLASSVSQVITTLTDADHWIFLTLQVQKNTGSAADPGTGLSVAQGFYVYAGSQQAGFSLPWGDVEGNHTGLGWSLQASGGALWVDDVYWEGGLTADDLDARRLYAFDAQAIERPACATQLTAGLPVRQACPWLEMDPLFRPQAEGWLGADAAFSVQLAPGRVLWLFGDTLLGKLNGNVRQLQYFINNSIAIHDISAGLPGTVEYAWGGSTSAPASFFTPQAAGTFYWPGVACMVSGELFVFLSTIQTSGGIGFESVGTMMVRVANPQDSSASWTMTYTDLAVGDNNHRGVNAGIYAEGDYVYFIGYDDPGDNVWQRRAVLARVAASALTAGGDVAGAFEYWQAGEVWGTDREAMQTLFTPGVTETNLQYDAQLGVYLAATYSVFDSKIYLTSAPALTGPWSQPVCVAHMPEMLEGRSLIAYAVKPHPELSTAPGQVVLTYAVNSLGDISPVLEANDLYYPRFVRVELGEVAAPTGVPATHWTWSGL